MGGSSIYLASHYQVKVIGITLSQTQLAIAAADAASQHLNQIIFKIEDALSLTSFADQSVDIVWSLESCEQFYDKSLFIEQAYRVLKPGGKLLLVTWCSDRVVYSGRLAKKYKQLCTAFDVPYMPTIDWYADLLKKNHFTLIESLDWSEQVKKSWEIGISLLKQYSLWKLFKMVGLRGVLFAWQVRLMRTAFAEKRVRYGVFIASKNSD